MGGRRRIFKRGSICVSFCCGLWPLKNVEFSLQQHANSNRVSIKRPNNIDPNCPPTTACGFVELSFAGGSISLQKLNIRLERTVGCPLSNHHSSTDSSLSASVLFALFSKMLEILAIQNICLRTSYMGISTFSIWFHVEYQLQASNRLHQNAEVRSVRAHPDATPPNEHQYARSHRSSMNWWRNHTFRELKNRYLLCHEE